MLYQQIFLLLCVASEWQAVQDGIFKGAFICRLALDSLVTGVQGSCGGDWCVCFKARKSLCDLWSLPLRCPPCRPAHSCPVCWSDPESLTLSCPHPSPYNTHWTLLSFTHQLTLVNLSEGRLALLWCFFSIAYPTQTSVCMWQLKQSQN